MKKPKHEVNVLSSSDQCLIISYLALFRLNTLFWKIFECCICETLSSRRLICSQCHQNQPADWLTPGWTVLHESDGYTVCYWCVIVVSHSLYHHSIASGNQLNGTLPSSYSVFTNLYYWYPSSFTLTITLQWLLYSLTVKWSGSQFVFRDYSRYVGSVLTSSVNVQLWYCFSFPSHYHTGAYQGTI